MLNIQDRVFIFLMMMQNGCKWIKQGMFTALTLKAALRWKCGDGPGLPRKKRIWIGGLSGVAYQSIIEMLDGFSSEYGFSPGDFAANIVGSATFISQELAWDEQRIKLKFSFHNRNYGEADLNARADKIYGSTAIERFIKDYNGQSYWVSANISFLFS